MKTKLALVGAFDAKNRLSELLDCVSRGAEFVITRHDKPVARLVPEGIELAVERLKASEALKELRKRYSLDGLSARALIEDGRK